MIKSALKDESTSCEFSRVVKSHTLLAVRLLIDRGRPFWQPEADSQRVGSCRPKAGSQVIDTSTDQKA
eukprot:6199873-Pleurochrysis_carterae.AAC.2